MRDEGDRERRQQPAREHPVERERRERAERARRLGRQPAAESQGDEVRGMREQEARVRAP